MLRLENITKVYGDKIAVDHLNLDVEKGKITGFIGHNGAGKTTTIKAICGILKLDEGDIKYDDISALTDPIEYKKKIAYIPDNPDMYEFLTGIQYLNFIADVFGVSAEDRQAKIKDLGEKFSFFKDLSNPISAFSHGTKQKLAITAAFLHDPEVIIMDEPFVGLDPTATHTLKEMMRDFCDRGNTVFFSTHVLDVAEKLCDNIAMIKGGKPHL